MTEVTFPALIKAITIKSLVSGDKSAEIRLWFRPDDDTLDSLNRLHRADEEVMIALVPIALNNCEIKANAKRNSIQKRTGAQPKGQAKGGEV